jgi:hypothetical protein
MSTDLSRVSERKDVTSCNASTSFNFTVGAAAIAVAGVIGYFLYTWLAASG